MAEPCLCGDPYCRRCFPSGPTLVKDMSRRELMLRLVDMSVQSLDAFLDGSRKSQLDQWLWMTLGRGFMGKSDDELRKDLETEGYDEEEELESPATLEELAEDYEVIAGTKWTNTTEQRDIRVSTMIAILDGWDLGDERKSELVERVYDYELGNVKGRRLFDEDDWDLERKRLEDTSGGE